MKPSDKLALRAVQNGVISEQDAEIYSYSYRALFMTVLLWGSAILIGIIFRQFLGLLCFMLFFVPLREYAGGIHVKSQWLCYGTTIAMFIILSACAYLPIVEQIQHVMFLGLPAPSLALILFAPQEVENKPASDNEIRYFRKTTRIILTVEVALILVIHFAHIKTSILYFCLCGLYLCALLVVVKAVARKLNKT